MAYRFRMETLLRLKARRVEIAEADLARLIRKRADAMDVLMTIRKKKDKAIREFESELTRGILADAYRLGRIHISNLDRRCKQLEQRIMELDNRIKGAKHRLETCHQEKELVERLRSRDYQAYLSEQQRREQKEADDFSITNYLRRNR